MYLGKKIHKKNFAETPDFGSKERGANSDTNGVDFA